MTADEGRRLERGVIVYWGTDWTDRGVVVDLTIDPDGTDVIWILWGRDVNASAHRVTELTRIHRWYRRDLASRHLTGPAS